jgi:hypothetical protein
VGAWWWAGLVGDKGVGYGQIQAGGLKVYFHCCQVLDQFVCKCLKKIRPNGEKIQHFLKFRFVAFNDRINTKFSCFEVIFQKKLYYMGKNMFSLKIFSAAFVKIRRPYDRQIFPANHFFYGRFELFCRIFGRLATVSILMDRL